MPGDVSGWRPRQGGSTLFTPEREVAQHPALGTRDGFRAERAVADPIVRFVKDGAVDAGGLDALAGGEQVSFVRNPQQDQVAVGHRLPEVCPRLQAGVAGLDELVGQGQVGADQEVGVAERQLSVRHACPPGWR